MPPDGHDPSARMYRRSSKVLVTVGGKGSGHLGACLCPRIYQVCLREVRTARSDAVLQTVGYSQVMPDALPLRFNLTTGSFDVRQEDVRRK